MSTAQGVIGSRWFDIRELSLLARAGRENWSVGETLYDDVIDRLAPTGPAMRTRGARGG